LIIDDESDTNDGEGEMPRPQRPAAMAAQTSDKFEDRASTPDIIYVGDGGGDTEEILTSDGDEDGEVSTLFTAQAIGVTDLLTECESLRDRSRGLNR
jgi:hypothetical protein